MELTDWAEVCVGVVNLSTLQKRHGNPADAFKVGDYGAAAAVLHQSNCIRMLTDGPFPRDFDDDRFEKLIRCMRCLRTYGHVSWLEWCQANWGTKWNAYQQEKISPTCVRFDTAWSAPIPFLKELSLKFPAETFRLRWADEDFGCNTGVVVVKAGEVIDGGRLENDSDESHALALELVHGGEVPDHCKWENGRLVYLDE